MKEILKDVWMWSSFSEEKGYPFNGFVVRNGDDKVIIDPPHTSPEADTVLERMQPFKAIYLTNKDHERNAQELRKKFKLPLWIHEKDRAFLKEAPDKVFHEGTQLACHLEALHLPDQKSPGESALYDAGRGILILGDALIGDPPGKLRLLPSQKYKDPKKAKTGLERLRSLFFEVILVGDGEPVLVQAHDRLEQFFLKDIAEKL